eukprot:TRINITY_DN10660_c0_g1_i1.p1 TRINITY_DN10660_c0_g1~~TRINITY_DN10660_c0_g1_i1.p1  ORF type:complete len:182 (-),score=32.78 TRINITY_DN10660_c0_g1_i1:215-760(-)
MGIQGIKEASKKLHKIIRKCGKSCYTVIMGTPTPTKLANFAEVQMWVQLSDVTAHILDSKEYFVPIITPQEALIALCEEPWTGNHVLGFQCILEFDETKLEENTKEDRRDLVIRNVSDRLSLITSASEQEKKDLLPKSATEFFALKRNFQGLDFRERKDASLVQKGLSGRAARYQSEPNGL